jgi:DNA-binding ferritin-like protein
MTTTTEQQLTQVFNDNFVAYFRSHAAHVNIEGRNFASDHELLSGIYTSLQDQIDTIGELLRSLGVYMPCALADVITDSHISADAIEGSADELLESVREDLEHLKDCYEELMAVAEDENHAAISNYCQDRILVLTKQIWQLTATLS